MFVTPRGFEVGSCSFGGLNAVQRDPTARQTVPRGELAGAVEAAKLYVDLLTSEAWLAQEGRTAAIALDASYTVKGWADPRRRQAANWDLWRQLDGDVPQFLVHGWRSFTRPLYRWQLG